MQGVFQDEQIDRSSLPPPPVLADRQAVFRLFLLVLVLLSIPIFSEAQPQPTNPEGYYQVTCTQGNITSEGQGFATQPHEELIASPNYKKYWGGVVANWGGATTLIPAKATLTGPIHVKLTWTPKFPGQPPPQAIIIEEYCKVISSAHSRNTSVVHSENGFGDPEVLSFDSRYDKISTCSQRHFRTLPTQNDIAPLYGNDDRLERPPLETTYEWDVNVSGSGKGLDLAEVDLFYTCQPHIVSIRTTGTTNIVNVSSEERKLLVGQGIYPRVTPYMDNDPVKGSYITQHQHWTFDKKMGSVEAKEPFNHWTGGDSIGSASLIKFPQDGRAAASTNPMVLDARRTYNASTGSELTSAGDKKLLNGLQLFHWSLKPPSSVTPIFVDATLTIGTGLINPPVDLKFKLSQKITVVRPTATCMSEEGTINIQGDPDIIAQTGDAQLPRMAASKLIPKTWLDPVKYDSATGVGDKWLGTVQEPAIFEKNPGATNAITGFWSFAQLIKPNRGTKDETGTVLPWNWNNSNLQLDVSYPYTQNTSDLYASLDFGWKASPNSGQHTTNDSPYMLLANAGNMNAQYQEASMHDDFQVYQMYYPPNFLGSDSEWVPLQYMEWHTDGDSTPADIQNQTLQLFDPDTGNLLAQLTCLLNHILAPVVQVRPVVELNPVLPAGEFVTPGVTRPIPPTDITVHPIWQTIVNP